MPKLSPQKRVLRSTKPTTPLLTEQEVTDTDADGETYAFNQPRSQGLKHGNVLVEDSDDADEEKGEDRREDVTTEDPHTELNPDKWNVPVHAFGIYLLQYMGHPASDIDLVIQDEKPIVDPFDNDDDVMVSEDVGSPKDQDEFDEDEEVLILELMLSSSPGLTQRYSSSSSSQAPSPFPLTSSPSHDSSFPSPSTPSLAGSIFPDAEVFSLEQHYPNTKYMNTPAPPKKRTHRRRIERVQKRMDKMKRQGWLCARDESVSVDEGQKNEVDQLAEDDSTEEKWVKPELKEGEVWDPFGDELEVWLFLVT